HLASGPRRRPARCGSARSPPCGGMAAQFERGVVTGTDHTGVHVPIERGESFAQAFDAASGPAVLRGDAVVDQPYVDRGAVGFQRQSAASRLTVPKDVGGALTYERAEQRLQRWETGRASGRK